LGSTTIQDPSYKTANLYNVIYDLQHPSADSQGVALEFKNAVIANGVAKIYLTGSLVYGLDDECDVPRVPAQIQATASQFSNVISVQTYLNGKLVDWNKFESEE
jgi:hypothetical protein